MTSVFILIHGEKQGTGAEGRDKRGVGLLVLTAVSG